MSSYEMRLYLADALDQEACKATLIAALESRVIKLQSMGVASQTIIDTLDDLCADPYQINDDVIVFVMESLILATI